MGNIELLHEIDLLLKDIKECIKSYNAIELDFLKRKAIVISEEAFGKNNAYTNDIQNIYFLSTKYGPKSIDIYENDFMMDSGKLKNIMEEIKFKIQRKDRDFDNNSTDSSQSIVPVRSRRNGVTINSCGFSGASNQSNRVFLVHGHDEAMKQTIARFLENLGLQPIILQEQPGGSTTIIERFEANSDVSFAIILFSPDDLTFLDNNTGSTKYRARQNVIFEMGYFIGRLSRNRVVSLCKDLNKLDLPSDYHGIIYIEYDSMGGWKPKLFKELKACYADIDANKMI